MANVIVGQPAFCTKIRHVLETASRRSAAAAVINRLGPGVRTKKRKPVGESFLRAKLSRVIAGGRAGFVHVDASEQRIRPAALCRTGAKTWLVDVRVTREVR